MAGAVHVSYFAGSGPLGREADEGVIRAALTWRVTATVHRPVNETLPDGSFLSVISSKPTHSGTFEIPLSEVDDPRLATHIPVRVIEYTVTKGDDPRPPYSGSSPPSSTPLKQARWNWPPPTSNGGNTKSHYARSKHNSSITPVA